MMGRVLTVQPYLPEKAQRSSASAGGNDILVTGISEEFMDDLYTVLENQRKGGGKVNDIKMQSNDVALVSFAQEKGTTNLFSY